ncbi:MAG: M48 family metalloprotease [Candidatus Micrarchaeota archaeon]|nr:M48 family metalloprotease [Candidatus Micrarchaeota archaeon]
MAGLVRLRATMYITLALIFAIAFGIIYAVMAYIGFGILVVLPITFLFFLFQWYLSPVLMGAMSRLKYLEPGERQGLQDTVKRLAEQAGVPVPRVAISPRQDPNAYVFGRTRSSSTLVIHQGLLPMLNDAEMESVLAHEIGHLRHNDVAIMMVVSFLPMLLYIIAQNMIFTGAFGGGRGNSGNAAAIGWGALVFYFILQLMTLALSRARESFADEYSATTVKKPQNLASSLLKISAYNVNPPSGVQQQAPASSAAKALYFANPFTSAEEIQEIKNHEADLKELLPDLNIDRFIRQMQGESTGAHAIANIFSNHPPIWRRVLDLAELNRQMKG